MKEIAWQHGHAASFLPKWHQDKVGSSSHVHQSLWQEGNPAFYEEGAALGMSQLMKQHGVDWVGLDRTYRRHSIQGRDGCGALRDLLERHRQLTQQQQHTSLS